MTFSLAVPALEAAQAAALEAEALAEEAAALEAEEPQEVGDASDYFKFA